jgi:hypothetical protein
VPDSTRALSARPQLAHTGARAGGEDNEKSPALTYRGAAGCRIEAAIYEIASS